MENTTIFAPRLNHTMGSYHISLDDDLVAKVEQLLKVDGSFQAWLQTQVEAWLNEKINDVPKKRHCAISDEELSEMLKAYPPLHQDAFPDLNEEAYSEFVTKHSGHLPKDAEKWL